MSSKVLSAAVLGLDAEIVEVEADTGGGDMGKIAIVGLPDAAVSESRERVRSAIRNSDLFLPKVKITINLAPADLGNMVQVMICRLRSVCFWLQILFLCTLNPKACFLLGN